MFNSARRLLAALLLVLGTTAALVVAGPAGSAQAAPANCGYPASACACPTLAVSTTAPAPGEAITVTGANFISGKRITLVLKPVSNTNTDRSYVLRTLVTGSDGTFTTTVTMPSGVTGSYDIHAVNGTPEGATTAAGIACPVDPTAALNFAAADDGQPSNNGAPSDNQPTTAFTGFNTLWFALLAAALISAGFYLNRRGKKIEVRSIRG